MSITKGSYLGRRKPGRLCRFVRDTNVVANAS
jgi:hypothetical protein